MDEGTKQAGTHGGVSAISLLQHIMMTWTGALDRNPLVKEAPLRR